MFDWVLDIDFINLLGIALLRVAGLLLICWGLWGDRSKGRPRCPKCWYDLRGTLPRLGCPECGHDARQERRLYRTRDDRLPIIVGVVLVLLSTYPLAMIEGWWHEQSAGRRLIAPSVLQRRIGKQVNLSYTRVTDAHRKMSTERMTNDACRNRSLC